VLPDGVIDKWFRWAALRYHPDRVSGDQRPMMLVNEFYAKLKELAAGG
jgi:curved DNA-binding protein CbpA